MSNDIEDSPNPQRGSDLFVFGGGSRDARAVAAACGVDSELRAAFESGIDSILSGIAALADVTSEQTTCP